MHKITVQPASSGAARPRALAAPTLHRPCHTYHVLRAHHKAASEPPWHTPPPPHSLHELSPRHLRWAVKRRQLCAQLLSARFTLALLCAAAGSWLCCLSLGHSLLAGGLALGWLRWRWSGPLRWRCGGRLRCFRGLRGLRLATPPPPRAGLFDGAGAGGSAAATGCAAFALPPPPRAGFADGAGAGGCSASAGGAALALPPRLGLVARKHHVASSELHDVA